jgi:hypothetical protein
MPFGSEIFLPVVSERRPRLAVAVLVAVVFETVFRAHVVERPRDGRLPAFEDIVRGGMPRTRVGAVGPTMQARARSDSRQAAAVQASVPGTIGVTPLPAGVLSSSEVPNVTRRRQGRWDVVACSGNSHGDSWARMRSAVVVWQRVAVGLIYPDRGRACWRHGQGRRAMMSPGARHSIAAEACLAAHERRKCGEGVV